MACEYVPLTGFSAVPGDCPNGRNECSLLFARDFVIHRAICLAIHRFDIRSEACSSAGCWGICLPCCRPCHSCGERGDGGNDADEDECRQEAQSGGAEQLDGQACGGLLDGAALGVVVLRDGETKLRHGGRAMNP